MRSSLVFDCHAPTRKCMTAEARAPATPVGRRKSLNKKRPIRGPYAGPGSRVGRLPGRRIGPTSGGPLVGVSPVYATSDPSFRRCSTSHFGGRPRRAGLARQSIGCSILTVRVVTSPTAVLPPQTVQRRRHQARTRVAVRALGGWKRIGPVGGQCSVAAVPASRPQSRHTISARNRRRRMGRGGVDGPSDSDVVVLLVPSDEGVEGVSVD